MKTDQTGWMPLLIWVFVSAHRLFRWFCRAAAHLIDLNGIIQLVHPRVNSCFFTHIHGSILQLSSSCGMFNFCLPHLFIEPVSERILCK